MFSLHIQEGILNNTFNSSDLTNKKQKHYPDQGHSKKNIYGTEESNIHGTEESNIHEPLMKQGQENHKFRGETFKCININK
jgi:hypothetical protein